MRWDSGGHGRYNFWYNLGRWIVKVILDNDPTDYILIDFRLPPQKFDQETTDVYKQDVYITAGATVVNVQLSRPRVLVGFDLFELLFEPDPYVPLTPGLDLNPKTGQLVGRPTSPGTRPVRINCVDMKSGESIVVADFKLHIAAPLNNKFVTVLRKNQKFNGPKVQVYGGAEPIIFSCVGCVLPVGIKLDSKTGQLSGTPTATGLFSDIQVIGMDNNKAQISLSPQMMIVRSEIKLEHKTLLTGLLMVLNTDTTIVYNCTIPDDQADALLSFKAFGLPDGVVVIAHTGTITGAPTESGVFTPSLIVIDEVTGAESLVNSKPFRLEVRDCFDDRSTCRNGGICVDKIPFDGKFECDCAEGYELDESLESSAAQQKKCIPAVRRNTSSGKESVNTWVLVCLCIVFGLATIGVCVLAATYTRKKTNSPTQYTFNDELAFIQELISTTTKTSSLDLDQADLVRPRSIDSKKLVVHEMICETETRQISKAQLTLLGVSSTIVMKCNKPGNDDPNSNFQLRTEAALLAQFNHPNILGLVGCTTLGPTSLLLEHCMFGSLKGLLRETACRGSVRPTVSYSLQNGLMFACQIANGMSYVHSKKYGHYNLSASSIFVHSTLEGSICKIAKFGVPPDKDQPTIAGENHTRFKRFARDGSEQSVRWKAIEWVLHSECSLSSDVWSFGVVLYEIFTLGALPYVGKTDERVRDALANGDRLPCPEAVPISLYNAIMVPCWENVTQRIEFSALISRLRRARLECIEGVSGMPSIASGFMREAPAASGSRDTLDGISSAREMLALQQRLGRCSPREMDLGNTFASLETADTVHTFSSYSTGQSQHNGTTSADEVVVESEV